MITLKDFLESIEERLKSPLISSFIICWIVYNWNILFALFLFNEADYLRYGAADFIEYVRITVTWDNGLWWPLLFALVYVFGFPFIRTGIVWFQTWIGTFTSNRRFKIMGSGSISVKKYLQLRETFNDNNLNLQKIIEEESQAQVDLAAAQTTINERDIELIALRNELNIANEQNDVYASTISASDGKIILKNEQIETLKQEKKRLEDIKNLNFIEGTYSIDNKKALMFGKDFDQIFLSHFGTSAKGNENQMSLGLIRMYHIEWISNKVYFAIILDFPFIDPRTDSESNSLLFELNIVKQTNTMFLELSGHINGNNATLKRINVK